MRASERTRRARQRARDRAARIAGGAISPAAKTVPAPSGITAKLTTEPRMAGIRSQRWLGWLRVKAAQGRANKKAREQYRKRHKQGTVGVPAGADGGYADGDKRAASDI